uniref:Uncharacterized protein n=1 Tax=Timema douglasi TaxID=61478 RepID=A0A7R8VMG4_TIMDO|nr:unnamed protein product [Timema douglasi]
MHTEEQGIHLGMTPRRMFDHLFPAPSGRDEPLLPVSFIAPSQPLENVVIPLGTPGFNVAVEDAAIIASAVDDNVAQPKESIFSESFTEQTVKPKHDITSTDPRTIEYYVGGSISSTTTSSTSSDHWENVEVMQDKDRQELLHMAETQSHFSQIQLRGTKPPPWFPDAFENGRVSAEGSQEFQRTCFKNELVSNVGDDSVVVNDAVCDDSSEDRTAGDNIDSVNMIMMSVMVNDLNWGVKGSTKTNCCVFLPFWMLACMLESQGQVKALRSEGFLYPPHSSAGFSSQDLVEKFPDTLSEHEIHLMFWEHLFLLCPQFLCLSAYLPQVGLKVSFLIKRHAQICCRPAPPDLSVDLQTRVSLERPPKQHTRYYLALPETNGPTSLESPSQVMLSAWKAVHPNMFEGEGRILINKILREPRTENKRHALMLPEGEHESKFQHVPTNWSHRVVRKNLGTGCRVSRSSET